MKLLQAVLAGVGTFYAVLIPAKVLGDQSRAYESRGDGPEAVSAEPRPPAPASGHSRHEVIELIDEMVAGYRAATLKSFGLEEDPKQIDWVHWVLPAITDALAGHTPHLIDGDPYVRCLNSESRRHGKFEDWQDWREHAAEAIAKRIHSAALAQK